MTAIMFQCNYKGRLAETFPPTATLRRDTDSYIWLSFSEDIGHDIQIIMNAEQFAAFKDRVNLLPDAPAPVEPIAPEDVPDIRPEPTAIVANASGEEEVLF